MKDEAVPISSTHPDWSREAKAIGSWSPSRSLLGSIRSYQRASGPFGFFKRRLAVLRHRFWSVVTGADIPVNSSIGGGLLLPHPNGVVIHPHAQIGVNCLIFQQVTIGATQHGVPTIGGTCRHRRGCETNRAYHCRRPRANWRQCGSTGKCSGLWDLRDSSRKANRSIAKFCQMQKSCYVPRSKPTISVRLLHYKK